MKRWILSALVVVLVLLSTACASQKEQTTNITATTMPVYSFTKALCEGTSLCVQQLVQENISCLHDYTLSVKHMKMLEGADLIIISGGGLEDFLNDALQANNAIIDASAGIDLHCHEDDHSGHGHHHELDPHFWLSIEKARKMARTICDGLKSKYPQLCEQFEANMFLLDRSFDELSVYAEAQLSALKCREIITFHDGFSYMAEDLNLSILHSVEEESGSEASALDLIQICDLVNDHRLPAVFVETNGSDSAAKVVCAETGAKLYSLDMAMSGNDYFGSMYYNINTLKEALG